MIGVTPAPGTATVTAPVAGTAPPAASTAPAGGLQVDVNIESKVTYDDNFGLDPVSPGDSTVFDNTLRVGVSNITAIDDFRLDASGVYRFADFAGSSASGFEDPTVKFRYRRDTGNSVLTAYGRFRDVDRDFLDPFLVEQVDPISNVLLGGGGQLKTKSYGAALQTGINDPIGFNLSVDHDEQTYTNVTDPALVDNQTDQAAAGVSMRVSPMTQLRLGASIEDYTADDTVQTDRRTLDYTLGVTQDINPVLLLDAQIGWTDVETDTVFGTTTRDGITGSLQLTKVMSNGTAFVSADSSINENGRTQTLRFGRDLQLPTGTLSATLGAADSPSGEVFVIGSLAYGQQLRNSTVTLAVDRGLSTDSLSNDVIDTRVRLGYGYIIDSVSRINMSLNWGHSEPAGTNTAPTVTRTSFNASYSRALTQDWDLTGGVVLRDLQDSGASGDARSNAVFLSLDRDFSFRP
ncbi:hypothetical protein [Defluviimonas salinarum]|uniref:hypothetical protein n=1 Tax=Defluviimonas salinarum TaxID=2992147 RepID=UPI002231FD0B|nr:hypothetical protein [Defluviimonas salinarum]